MNVVRWLFERFGMPPELEPDEGLAVIHQLLAFWYDDPEPEEEPA